MSQRDQILARYNKAKELIKSGRTIKEATEEAKIGNVTFYKYQKLDQEAPKAKKPKFIDLPLKKEPSNVAVIVCQPSQISDILKELL